MIISRVALKTKSIPHDSASQVSDVNSDVITTARGWEFPNPTYYPRDPRDTGPKKVD